MIEERALLPALRERIRRIERPAAATHGVVPFGVAAIDRVVPFGVAAIDRVLPGGGLARGALHEILGVDGDEEDGALAAAFAAGIIGRLGAGPHPNPPPCPRRAVRGIGGGCEAVILRNQTPVAGLGPAIHVFGAEIVAASRRGLYGDSPRYRGTPAGTPIVDGSCRPWASRTRRRHGRTRER